MLGWIDGESFGFFCPDFADVFIGGEALESLQSPGEVVGQVDLSVSVSNGKAELCIQDNGPGIPLAERERVFDAFYRTLGSEQSGSGLGLSIVQTIARRIGAEICLDFTDDAQQTGLKVTVIAPIR